MNSENQQDHTGINLFKKWRVDVKVFGHNVETEEVAVDPRASHGQTVHVLMLVGCSPKQGQPLRGLITNTHKKKKRADHVHIDINGCQLNTQTTGDISESKAAVASANSGPGVSVIEFLSGAVYPATTPGTQWSL